MKQAKICPQDTGKPPTADLQNSTFPDRTFLERKVRQRTLPKNIFPERKVRPRTSSKHIFPERNVCKERHLDISFLKESRTK